MSDEDSDEQEPKTDDDADEEAKPAAGGKKKLVIIAVAVLVIVAGGGGGAYFFMHGGHAGEEKKQGSMKAVIELPEPPTYYEFPRMLVDMKTARCRSPFMKFLPVVEISASYVPKLEEAEVKIIDKTQTFLRSQTRQDMVGKAGSEKLRAAFIKIVNEEIYPDKLINVLFREMLLQ